MNKNEAKTTGVINTNNPKLLLVECVECGGAGCFTTQELGGTRYEVKCEHCNGKKYVWVDPTIYFKESKEPKK